MDAFDLGYWLLPSLGIALLYVLYFAWRSLDARSRQHIRDLTAWVERSTLEQRQAEREVDRRIAEQMLRLIDAFKEQLVEPEALAEAFHKAGVNAVEVMTPEDYESFEQALARKAQRKFARLSEELIDKPKRKAKTDDGREPKEKRKHVI